MGLQGEEDPLNDDPFLLLIVHDPKISDLERQCGILN